MVPRPEPPSVIARYFAFYSPHAKQTIALFVVRTSASPKPIRNRTTSDKMKNKKPLSGGTNAIMASAVFEISMDVRPRMTAFFRPIFCNRALKNGENTSPAASSIPSTSPT